MILPDRSDTYFVPDLAVTCGPVDPTGRSVETPVVVVENLSPSTTAHDQGLKGRAYRRIASIQEILFVSSDARRAELWRREGETWRIFDLIGDATVTLISLDIAFRLAEIYEGIEL